MNRPLFFRQPDLHQDLPAIFNGIRQRYWKGKPDGLKRIMMAVSLAVAVIFGGVATALAHDYTLHQSDG